jgi:hypothetical protein
LEPERPLAAVLPTDDPAGTIATGTAGMIEFSATLWWDGPDDAPGGPTLSTLPEGARCSVVETDDPVRCTRAIVGEILALSERDLGSALDAVLRSLTIAASLSDAVIETSAFRSTPPGSVSAKTLQHLALDLWDVGFGVRFARSWTPVPPGAVGLGVSGCEQELRDFLEAHPSWRTV